MDEFQSVFDQFKIQCSDEIFRISRKLSQIFMDGGKLLLCGNGGSAADAQHLAAEFMSSFGVGLKRRSLPAIALTTDTSIITAISNDFDFEISFSRQIEGLGQNGDALLVISTSGESKNCLKAVDTAKNLGLCVMALTREDSSLYQLADFPLGVPSKNTQHIQECHILAYHVIAELIEQDILKGIS
jgi:D-sedoheptulose 7-phosphate isomerase